MTTMASRAKIRNATWYDEGRSRHTRGHRSQTPLEETRRGQRFLKTERYNRLLDYLESNVGADSNSLI
jgi:hypothetical protein